MLQDVNAWHNVVRIQTSLQTPDTLSNIHISQQYIIISHASAAPNGQNIIKSWNIFSIVRTMHTAVLKRFHSNVRPEVDVFKWKLNYDKKITVMSKKETQFSTWQVKQ